MKDLNYADVKIDGIYYWIQKRNDKYICLVSNIDVNNKVANIPEYITVENIKIPVITVTSEFSYYVKHCLENLQEINVDKNNHNLGSYDGILYRKICSDYYDFSDIEAVPSNIQKKVIKIPRLSYYDLTYFEFCRNIKTLYITLSDNLYINHDTIYIRSEQSYWDDNHNYVKIRIPRYVENVIINNNVLIKKVENNKLKIIKF